MFNVELKTNAAAFSRDLNRFQRKQMPFATMKALNDTAFDIRKKVVPGTFKRAFPKGKNKGFIQGRTMRVKKATKQRLIASIYDSAGLTYLEEQHVQGRVKTARGGRLAIPQHGRGLVRRGARGVPKAQQPRALLAADDVFVKRINSRNEGIWKRKKKGLVLLYTLASHANVDPKLRFYENVAKASRKWFPRKLRHNFNKAWASRR